MVQSAPTRPLDLDALRATAQAFARDEMRPVALQYDESEEYPLDVLHRAAAARAHELRPARGVRRRRRREPARPLRGDRGARLGRLPHLLGDRAGRLLRRRRCSRSAPRSRSAAGCRAVRRRAAACVGRDHRARARLRRRRDRDDRRSPRRRLRPQRAQEVHRQRPHRRPLHRLRHRRAGQPLARDHRVPRRERTTRASSAGRACRRWAAAASRPQRSPSRTASCPRTGASARRAQGFRGLMRVFDVARVQLAAGSVGLGRAALELAVDYAKEREAFGRPIHEFQAVSFRLADAKLKLEQARLMTHRRAPSSPTRASRSRPRPRWPSSPPPRRPSSRPPRRCMTLGGVGYIRDSLVQKWLPRREARRDLGRDERHHAPR